MMPIIRPITIPVVPLTEYEKEQILFARLKADLRWRNRVKHQFKSWWASLRTKRKAELHPPCALIDPCLTDRPVRSIL